MPGVKKVESTWNETLQLMCRLDLTSSRALNAAHQSVLDVLGWVPSCYKPLGVICLTVVLTCHFQTTTIPEDLT
jgi:hypothetical protein